MMKKPTYRILTLICLCSFTLILSACTRKNGPAPVAQLGLDTRSVAGRVLVRDNDTLWTIAQKHQLPLQDIIAINDLTPPYALETGQRLKLPKPVSYTVQEKDTLYSIAKTFRIDVNQLVRLNNLPSPYRLRAQQTLTLPTPTQYETAYKSASLGQDAYAPLATYPDPAPRNTDITPEELPPLSTSSRRPQPIQRSVLPSQNQQASVLNGHKPARKIIPPRSTQTGTSNAKFIWPVRGEILSGFGPKSGGLHNDGINIGVPSGTPVQAASGGKVVYVGDDLNSFGNLILVRHDNGWVSAYAHLDNIKIRRGTVVKQGQVLGTVGRTGNVKSPQLHFELRKGSSALNPSKHLS